MNLADVGWAIAATTPVVLLGIGWAWTNARRHAATRIDKSAAERGLDLLPAERDAIVRSAAGRVRTGCVGAFVGTVLAALLLAVAPGDAEFGVGAQYAVAAVALAGAALTESGLVLARARRQPGGTKRVATLEARGLSANLPGRNLIASTVALAGAVTIIGVAVERGAFSLFSGVLYAATLVGAAVLLLLALSRLVSAPSRAPSERERAVDDVLSSDSVRRLVQYVSWVPTLGAVTTYAVLTNYFPVAWSVIGFAVIVVLGLLMWWADLARPTRITT